MSEPVALKIISWDKSETSADVRRRALRELSHLRDCWHSNIVRCYGACLWEEQIGIAFELLPRGTLHAALSSRSLQWGSRYLPGAVQVIAIEGASECACPQLIHPCFKFLTTDQAACNELCTLLHIGAAS